MNTQYESNSAFAELQKLANFARMGGQFAFGDGSSVSISTDIAFDGVSLLEFNELRNLIDNTTFIELR